MPVTRGQLIAQADMDALAALANAVPELAGDYAFPADGNWLDELNRIRGDIFDLTILYDATPALAIDDEWLVSGPWAVAVGPSLLGAIVDAAGLLLPCYKDVTFYFADAPGLELHTGIILGTEESPTSITNSGHLTSNQTLTVDCDQDGALTARLVWNCYWFGGGAAPDDPPDIGTITKSATPATGVTWSVEGSGEQFQIIATVAVDLVAGVNTIDFSVTAPANYSLSPTNGASGFNGVMLIDGFFPLASATVIEDTAGLDRLADVKKLTAATHASATVIDCHGVEFGPGWQVSDLEVHGLFTAKTLPTAGVNTYINVDLPQYLTRSAPAITPGELKAIGPGDEQFSSPRQSASGLEINTVDPAVKNRGALWPVFRDTEYGEWNGERPIPYWPLDDLHLFGDTPGQLLEPAGEQFAFLFIATETTRFELDLVGGEDLLVYVREAGFPNPNDPSGYDFVSVGGFIYPDDVPPALLPLYVNTTIFYLIQNPTAAIVNYSRRTETFADDPEPRFFPTRDDGRPYIESYSYLVEPVSAGKARLPIPFAGYVIYDLIVRRRPRNNAHGIALAPTDEPTLAVKVGTIRAGMFHELIEVEIPENEAEIRTAVLWPVVTGASLFYQCQEAVIIYAAACQQPQMHSKFAPEQEIFSETHGTFSGRPWFTRTALRFNNTEMTFPDASEIVFPVPSDAFNALEALLTVLQP